VTLALLWSGRLRSLGVGTIREITLALIRAVRRGVFPLVVGGRREALLYLDRVAERIDRIPGPAFVSGRTYVFSDGTFELRRSSESVRRATGHAFPLCAGFGAKTGGGLSDWIRQITTGKEGHAKEALARLDRSFCYPSPPL
jgi:hypothetical protein